MAILASLIILSAAMAPAAKASPIAYWEQPVKASPLLYAPVRAALRESRVSMPVLVPGSFPRNEAARIYAKLVRADARGYRIELARQPDCEGMTGCHDGSITGKRSPGTPLAGRPVRLALGVTAYRVDGVFRSYWSDSTATFDWRGFRYVFAHKGPAEDFTTNILRIH